MSSVKVYAIVYKGGEVCGHGETSTYIKLGSKETYSTVPHPVFRTRHNAEEYVAKWKKEHYVEYDITELELI
jgi:hypothetical protein